MISTGSKKIVVNSNPPYLPRQSTENYHLVNEWVNGRGGGLSHEDRSTLKNFAAASKTKADRLERVEGTDPKYRVGQIVDLGPRSFTRKRVSRGENGGQIGWKSSDEAITMIHQPTRGHDVDYSQIHGQMSVSDEAETIVGGKYRVLRAGHITEPGTRKDQGYRTRAYLLAEHNE